MHTAEQTDMTKLTVACHNSANAPKSKTVFIFCAIYSLQNMVNNHIFFQLIILKFYGENYSICCCHSQVLNMTKFNSMYFSW